MPFIVMNLKGKFKLSPQRHQYVITAIDILLHTKEANEAAYVYLGNIYLKPGGSHTILSNNGTQLRTGCSCKLPPS